MSVDLRALLEAVDPGFLAWAEADAPLRNEWCMTRRDARPLAAAVNSLPHLLDRLERLERVAEAVRPSHDDPASFGCEVCAALSALDEQEPR